MAVHHQCSHFSVILAVREAAPTTEASPACSLRLSSSFIHRAPPYLRSSALRRPARKHAPAMIRALEFDQDTIVAIAVGIAGIAVGIAVPAFFEAQMKGSESRENDQPCFPCAGSGAQTCRFCLGAGNITIELNGGEKEVSKCVNCEGAGSMTCNTCQGSGIQPRYLDRREFKDDD